MPTLWRKGQTVRKPCQIEPEPPLLVSGAEAARMLGAKPWGIYQACQSGDLPAGRIGEQIVIPVGEVYTFARTVVEQGMDCRVQGKEVN